jgi:hypothetical protein
LSWHEVEEANLVMMRLGVFFADVKEKEEKKTSRDDESRFGPAKLLDYWSKLSRNERVEITGRKGSELCDVGEKRKEKNKDLIKKAMRKAAELRESNPMAYEIIQANLGR